jgi:RNA polymerase sigma-70 factor (ECF subfamily)
VQAPLYRHIDSIVRDATVAEDVLQDVLIVVSRKVGGLRDPRWFRAWAYRIASRAAVRRARRTSGADDALPDEWEQQPGTEPESLDLALRHEAVERSVDTLPTRSRLVVRMHYFDDLTIGEIAEALEIPLGTVKSRLAYGLHVLRRVLDADLRDTAAPKSDTSSSSAGTPIGGRAVHDTPLAEVPDRGSDTLLRGAPAADMTR